MLSPASRCAWTRSSGSHRLPVGTWLPELANLKVQRRNDDPVADTVPAKRSIRVRDLMTMRAGYGAIMVFPIQYPIQHLLEERGLAPGADMVSVPPDQWLSRLENIPLLHQPAEEWHYDSASKCSASSSPD